MKKYLAITAALALTLTACGQAEADSTPTPTAATEATASPAEQPQSIGSGALRLLTAAADGVYYQALNDWEINYTDTMGRALIYRPRCPQHRRSRNRPCYTILNSVFLCFQT